uniref:Uncharacterized protein n=1 Tax=Physcomitrium patens TaxID=3218 RepID=A0A7I4CR54_PHYPA
MSLEARNLQYTLVLLEKTKKSLKDGNILNYDYKTYISKDDLKINLWNFKVNNQSYKIVDLKLVNIEDLIDIASC